jgi:hypothetical protein
MENKLETLSIKPEILFSERESEYRLITIESESKMDSSIKECKDFIKNESGSGKSTLEQDDLYIKAQTHVRDLKRELRDSKFKFYINRPQYMFVTDLILKKMEYDVNTVFVALELRELMSNMKELQYGDDVTLLSIDMTATEITYLYHLISTHKVRGLTKEAYLFASVLRRIGEISKIINYYDNESKVLVNEVTIWAAGFGTSVEDSKLEDVDLVEKEN